MTSQLSLFDKPQRDKGKPNTTPDGELACAFRTPWLDHWAPPLGTGKGCARCEHGQ